jgi:hypothetical protein
LNQTVYGENTNHPGYSYKEITLIEDDPSPVKVNLPKTQDLADINICGIDGSNQRINWISFYLIISRATLVNFRYSIPGHKPFFYTKSKNKSAVVWVDGNIFTDDVRLFTEDVPSEGGKSDILKKIEEKSDYPLLVRPDPSKNDRNPSAHAMGWAVKIQQGLELSCIKDVPTDIRTVCIRDGPLFSTSVTPRDNINGLNPIFSWDDQMMVSCSKRVKDSKLFVECLILNNVLRDYWFPNQRITKSTLESVATDSLLLTKILKPGYRTPLMAAVPRARSHIVEKNEGLMPLTCYYYRRCSPNTFIRLEIPKFLWDKNRELANKAIELVAWQHELGHSAPLVQNFADKRCQLQSEKMILKRQAAAALMKNHLEFPEVYEE